MRLCEEIAPPYLPSAVDCRIVSTPTHSASMRTCHQIPVELPPHQIVLETLQSIYNLVPSLIVVSTTT